MKTVKLAAAFILLGALAAAAALAAENAGNLDTIYQQALHKEEGEGDFKAAVDLYGKVVDAANAADEAGRKAKLRLGQLYERLGEKDTAVSAYKDLFDNSPGTPEAAVAGERLAALGTTQAAGQSSANKALEARLQMVLPDVNADTLANLVDLLRSAAGINIVIDARVQQMTEGERPPLPPINLMLKNVTVADALSLATAADGLDWIPWSGAVFIGDPGRISNMKDEAKRQAAAEAAEKLVAGPLDEGIRTLFKKLRDMALSEYMKRSTPPAGGQATEPPASSEPTAPPAPSLAPVEPAAGPRRWPPDSPAFGIRPAKVTLLDADIERASAAQVLNLETGEAVPVGADGDMHKFFAAHPGFDLFYDQQLVLVGDGTNAALLSEDRTPDNVPVIAAFDYESASGPEAIKEPGVYRASKQDMSFLAIEPGAHTVYIETKRGAWLLTGISHGEDSISFTVNKLR